MGRLSSDFPNAQSVDAALKRANKAEVDVNDLTTAMSRKVDYSDYHTETQNLQGQINQIVISSAAEAVVAPEVAQARVNADGVSFETLKQRLDAAESEVNYISNLSATIYNPAWEYGGINDNGSKSSSSPTNRARYERICTDEKIIITHSTFKSKWWLLRNGEIVDSDKSAWNLTDATINCMAGDIFRLTVEASDGTSTFIFSDIDLETKIKSKLVLTVEKNESDILEIKSEISDARGEFVNLNARLDSADIVTATKANISDLNATNDDLSNLKDMKASEISPTWEYGTVNDDGSKSSATPHNRARFDRLCQDENIIITHNTFKSKWWLIRNEVIVDSDIKTWNKNDKTVSCLSGDIFRMAVEASDGTSSFDLSDIDVDISTEGTLLAAVKNTTADVDVLLEDKENGVSEFIMPWNFNIARGIEQNIYYQNIIRNINAKSDIYSLNSTLRFRDYDLFSRYSPVSVGETSLNMGHKFVLKKTNNNNTIESPVLSYNILSLDEGAGLTKKVLFIGDSLTYNGQYLVRHIKDNLMAEDSMSVEFIGTLGTEEYPHEGRPSWGAVTYVTESSHTSESGSTFTNAFWNPTSEKFDFTYYMQQQGYSGVDYVFINLGTNDVGRSNHSVVTDAMQEIIDSIHDYDANIRVGLWLCPPRALIGNGDLSNNDKRLSLIKKQIDVFDRRISEKIYLVPVYFNVDPYHDFPTEEVPVSARNTGDTMIVATDLIHPKECGYQKMADMIYSQIKYFGMLDS